MRIGQNPQKKMNAVYRPKKFLVASLVFIPSLSGYYKNSLDILKIHIGSIINTKPKNCELLIFDNGSCKKVTDYLVSLKEKNYIDWLHFSNHNISKVGALNWIFSAVQNDFIIYTDSDILFRKGWLENTYSIFKTIENTGIVSAQPTFFDVFKGDRNKQQIPPISNENLNISRIRIDEIYFNEYLTGIGQIKNKGNYSSEVLAICNDSKQPIAILNANHHHFMIKNSLAKKVVPLEITGPLKTEDEKKFHHKIENLKFLQLSTPKSYIYHIGNNLSQKILDEFSQQSNSEIPNEFEYIGQVFDKKNLKYYVKNAIRKSKILKSIIERMYGILFALMHEE